jgi:hypothetical protein
MTFLSGIVKRALPTMGRRINEETLKIPIRKPISASLVPNLERWIGMVGIRRQNTSVKAK